MKKKLDIEINGKPAIVRVPDEDHRLHHIYAGQSRPQSVIIDILQDDDEVVIDIDTDPIFGNAVPISVIKGVDIRFYRSSHGVYPAITPDEAVAFVEGHASDFKALIEGHDTWFDGSNVVGGPTSDAARAAEAQISQDWDALESQFEFANDELISNEVCETVSQEYDAIASRNRQIDEIAEEIRYNLRDLMNVIADPSEIASELKRQFEGEKADREAA